MPAIVNEKKCTGCGLCEDACPVDAIEVKEEKAFVSDDCVECGVCVDECPNKAITLPE